MTRLYIVGIEAIPHRVEFFRALAVEWFSKTMNVEDRSEMTFAQFDVILRADTSEDTLTGSTSGSFLVEIPGHHSDNFEKFLHRVANVAPLKFTRFNYDERQFLGVTDE